MSPSHKSTSQFLRLVSCFGDTLQFLSSFFLLSLHRVSLGSLDGLELTDCQMCLLLPPKFWN